MGLQHEFDCGAALVECPLQIHRSLPDLTYMLSISRFS